MWAEWKTSRLLTLVEKDIFLFQSTALSTCLRVSQEIFKTFCLALNEYTITVLPGLSSPRTAWILMYLKTQDVSQKQNDVNFNPLLHNDLHNIVKSTPETTNYFYLLHSSIFSIHSWKKMDCLNQSFSTRGMHRYCMWGVTVPWNPNLWNSIANARRDAIGRFQMTSRIFHSGAK